MKKLLQCLFFIMIFTHAYATNVNRMIFFGDSLTDNGNLYELLLHIIPKSPPYYEGRFSNGPTWAENLARYYDKKINLTYKIYAVGGATAVYHFSQNSKPTSPPSTLELQINKYLIDELLKNKEQVLFTVWIGGNDYLFYSNNSPQEETTKVVNKIVWAINKLKSNGAKNFLILNLPDLSKTPPSTYSKMFSQAQLHLYTVLHNQKLDAAIQQLKNTNPNLNFMSINIYDIFNDLLTDIEKYNEKYHVNIVNTTDACWKGGYFIHANLYASLQRDIAKSYPRSEVGDVADFIVNSPMLFHVYQLGQRAQPCPNPNGYLFWDFIHPTAVVHDILARLVIEKMDAQIIG